MESTFGAIVAALGGGLPVLLGHLALALALLAGGVAIYTRLTPYDELALARDGNAAGGLAFSGAVVSLAIPVAATLVTSSAAVDIVIWGVVALALQLAAFFVASRLMRNLEDQIGKGNVAAATVVTGVQLGAALVNAAAVAG